MTTDSGQVDQQRDIPLLSQRVDALERQLSKAEDRVSSHAEAINRSEGRSGLISQALPIVIGIGGMIFGSVMWNGQQNLSTKSGNNSTQLAELRRDFESKSDQIGDTISRKQELDRKFERLNEEFVEVRTKQVIVQGEQTKQDRTLETLITDHTAVKGRVERAHVFIESAQEMIVDLQKTTGEQSKSLAGMHASVEAALVEVETQLRSLEEKATEHRKWVDRMVSTLWQKIFETPLSDYDFESSKIPANASSATGAIKNGK